MKLRKTRESKEIGRKWRMDRRLISADRKKKARQRLLRRKLDGRRRAKKEGTRKGEVRGGKLERKG